MTTAVKKTLALLALATVSIWAWRGQQAKDSGPEHAEREGAPEGRHDGTAVVPDANDRESIRKLGHAVDSLAERLATLERALLAPPVPTGQPRTERENSERRRPTEGELREEADARIHLLNDAFYSERVDAAWASSTQSALRALIANGKQEGSNLVSCDCRERSCRVEIRHSSELQGLEFERILDGQPMSYNLERRAGAHGEPVTVGYFVREGIPTSEHYIHQTDGR